MSGTEVVVFLFRLINFGALLGIGIYLFRRKMRFQIKTKIHEKEFFWQNLFTNKQALIDQQHKLDIEIDWQKKYGNQLLEKISAWSHATEKRKQMIAQEATVNTQKMYERSAVFNTQKEKQEILKEVVPLAFKESRAALKEQFLNENKSEEFLSKVLNFMEKSAQ